MTSPSRTVFQLLPDRHPQLLQRHKPHEVPVEGTSRLPQGLRRDTTGGQDGDDFWTPEQLGQREWIDRGIHSNRLHSLEIDASARSGADDLDAPPIRQMRLRLLDVPLTNNQGRSVQHLAVDLDLTRESIESVGVTLDLIAVKEAIHDGDVDAARPMAKSQLIEHESIGLTMVLSQHLAVQSPADVLVAHQQRPFSC
ncbi:hypothetical protein QA635_18650 [Bradyrhizobium brasilense]|nr:hypothetical protein [Bradyrhizobium australafricanum]WFU36317.1 hypothetical protein QA635_18650 [Bradyrhizobium australafricanum]